MTYDGGAVMASANLSHKDGKRTNRDRDTGSMSLHGDRAFADNHQFKLDARYYGAEYGSAGPVDNLTPDARQLYQKGSMDSRFSIFFNDLNDYSINLYGDIFKLNDKSQSGITSNLAT